MITYVYPEIGRALVSALGAAQVEATLPPENHLLRRAHADARRRALCAATWRGPP